MARVGSIKYQVSNIIQPHIAIGESKLQARNESGMVGENGHAVSDKFHSYRSLDNVRSHLNDLGKFAKSEFGIKDMSQITAEVVREWVESKDLSYRSASNYMSELNKLADHFSFTRDEIKELRQEFKETLRENVLESRAYSQALLNKVELPEKMQVVFELQKEYGLRVNEASHVNLKNLDENNVLHYQQKGGMWSEKEISPQLADKIREHAENGKFDVCVRTYANYLKEEIERNGGEWNGTHGIRHSFAQQKLSEGYSKSEVSAMMGHVREEITNTYLR